ncbi:tRNA (adenosine(37)-N6)-threonylcarbamoyltransferase complex ATPase subunit type 1 TsaE [Cyanobium sp. Alchichica 3B3-8F6]|uniref:tRNA (adenosine(37)-N6)-threonylcarbamoyltransferase complex ATPase subunit type 1 TsaE n=1 Tax=Synechococcales TaxID=1890424 RepID=UPI000B984E9E|nr:MULTISPECIES: tRNA (adenosine(37)-N6)-threonylcarbamoyltransferase complex ATPase subunit type 1 TsaE [Synechococcales]MCP9881698.1 tRNA (adenosine(37)-N6)-threonylcarbamoyltransferase complex ATPase subunit type 1 TsaE [Cyanobium sp. Alchichica 3B3-8F6]
MTHLLADATATHAFGRQLAARLSPGSTLLLQGDLGAGKTCLVQGLAAGLGITEPITSPTFALAQHYPLPRGGDGGGGGGLVHLDLYRLELPAAADELFAQEEEEARALGALLAVEWPERLSVLPAGCWRIQLRLADPHNPDAGRQLGLVAPGGEPVFAPA